MSILHSIFILTFLSISHAFLRCPLKIYQADPVNWSKFAEGYLLGLHKETIDRQKCLECMLFGDNMKDINRGIVHIEEFRDKWINKDNVAKADVYHVTKILLDIYNIFMVLLRPMDNIC